MKARLATSIGICVCLLGLSSLSPPQSDIPKLHEKMPCPQSDTMWAIAAAQTVHGCEVIRGGVKFFVGTIDGQTIAYISTRDTLFRTAEGVRVGATQQNVLKAGGSAILEEPYFCYYSQLPSGWRARFGGMPALDSLAGIALKRDSVCWELFLRDE